MKFLYFMVSIPMLFFSIILISLNPRLRSEYRLVKSTIATNSSALVDDTLIDILIAAEDHRYMSHFGFDPIAIGRAISRIIISKKIEGASTIEQQLVRTITKKRDISIKRKIEEISLSLMVSISNRKNNIAHIYLSLAYFGFNSVGYKSASTLLEIDGTSNDCAVSHGAAIVALLKRPMPVRKDESWRALHRKRQDYIVKRYIALTSRSTGHRRRADVAAR